MRSFSLFIGMLCMLLVPSISNAQSLQPDILSGSRPQVTGFACSSNESRQLVSLGNWGVWRTDDHGASWTDITTGIDVVSDGQFVNVSSLVTCDENADTVLAKLKFNPAEDWEFVLTEDGGNNWRAVDPGHSYHWETFLCIFDQSNHNHLIHMTEQHITHSYDLGRTWTTPINYDPEFYPQKFKLLQDRYTPSTLYLTSWAFADDQPCGIYRSEDYGDTWFSVLANPHQITGYYFLKLQDIVQLDQQTLIIPITSGKTVEDPYSPSIWLNMILISVDGGDTWSVQHELLPEGYGPCCLVEDGNSEGVLYSINDHPLENRGLVCSNGWPFPFQEISDLGAGLRNTSILVKNSYNGHVYLGLAGGGLFRLNPTGVPVQLPLPGGVGRSMLIRAHDENIYCSGQYDEVLEYYSNDTDEWSILSSEHADLRYLLRTPFIDNDAMMCIGKDEYVDQTLRNAIFQYNMNDHIWERISPEFMDMYITAEYDMPQYEPDNIYYDWLIPGWNGNGLKLIVHNISMDLWQEYPEEMTNGIGVYTITANEDSLYALGIYGDIFLSCTANPPWTPLGFPNAEQLWPLSRLDWQSDGLTIVALDAVYRYAGGSWTNNALPVEWRRAAICSDESGLLALWDNDPAIMYISDDWGESWLEVAIQWPDQVIGRQRSDIQLEFNGSEELLLSTSLGVFTMDLTEVKVTPDPIVQVFRLSMSSYPNPFNANTTVQYTLIRPGNVRLDVYDLLGRRVATLVDGMATPGGHSVSFDASELASGSYFLRLDTPDQTLHRRITLVK